MILLVYLISSHPLKINDITLTFTFNVFITFFFYLWYEQKKNVTSMSNQFAVFDKMGSDDIDEEELGTALIPRLSEGNSGNID